MGMQQGQAGLLDRRKQRVSARDGLGTFEGVRGNMKDEQKLGLGLQRWKAAMGGQDGVIVQL